MEQLPYPQDPLPSVLIVDDNAAIRKVIAWSLSMSGFQPIEAANGLEALAWMEQAARELLYPSVILLDLAMPEIDGYAFLEWLQITWVSRSPLPAILLTIASPVDEKTLALFPAIKQIIAKPFHMHDLLQMVRKWSA
jgi:DNA-binding response OmpR family regulator